MKAEAISRKAIKITSSIVDYLVLMIIVLLLTYAGYALWDSNQIYRAADKSRYTAYKPTAANQGKSFKELQALNGEVFAWLSVYGTNIDYPVTQGKDNMKYVDTNAEGQYSLSGSIFLNCHNSSDFSDFNSILYGHHMAKKVMFGEIESFSNQGMFDSHRYGNLYFDGTDHGIEFFAFFHTDAYDDSVFTPNIKGDQRGVYLDGMLAKAEFIRDIGVTTEDRVILLTTCSSSSTNGRDILAGRITDEVFEDQTINMNTGDGIVQTGLDSLYCLVTEAPIWALWLILILAIRLTVYILVTFYRFKRHVNQEKRR
jgi:sortase B